MGQILDDVQSVTNQSDEFKTTISELRKSSESIASITEKLDQILGKLNNGEGTLGKLVNDGAIHDNLNNLVNDIRTLVQDFKNNPTKYMKAYWKGKK